MKQIIVRSVAPTAFARARVYGTVFALLWLLPTIVAAQDTTLDRVQNLTATGRFTEARNTLDAWERSNADPGSSASPADRARALYLRGNLTTDPKAAEELYINVVLSFPSSEAAPHALLRLGQALVSGGEPKRAIAYLERLRSDYPRSSARETGWLWLARAQHATGATSAACATAKEGLTATRADNLRLLLELERDRACAAPANARANAAANTTAQTASTAEQPRFSVQAGAFRERASAEAVARELKSKGFEARVVVTEGSIVYRVRSGFFKTSVDADLVARRLREAGYTAIIVSDVAVERER